MKHALTYELIMHTRSSNIECRLNSDTIAKIKCRVFCSFTGYNPVFTMDHSLCTCFLQEDNYRSIVRNTHTDTHTCSRGFDRQSAVL